MKSTIVCLVACSLVLISATEQPIQPQVPLFNTDLLRQTRGDPPRFFGSGGGNGQSQQGNFGVQYPNGAGGQLSYGHVRGYGHDVSVDAMVPVWSKQGRLGESTLNVGGGVSQHFGGPSGNHMTDRRVGVSFVHRF